MKGDKLIHFIFILIGMGGLLFCHVYSGYGEVIINGYGANLFFPFVIYFIVRNFHLDIQTVALIALGGVYLQELGQLLGMYSGMFDYKDLIVDLGGVLIAIAVDRFALRLREKRAHTLRKADSFH